MIRLACRACDRSDMDGITDLTQAVGWTNIYEVQTYEEACKEVAPDEQGSVFEWWTHLGLCPDHRDAMN